MSNQEAKSHTWRDDGSTSASKKTRYVAIVAMSLDGHELVVLEKKKGPSHLIGKLTVPGGRIEQDEEPLEAAVRELKEETGLSVSSSEMIHLISKGDQGFSLDVYGCQADISSACTQEGELEPISIWSLSDLLCLMSESPDRVVGDLNDFIKAMREAFDLDDIMSPVDDQIQVSADGSTVLVHAMDGSTVGRFSKLWGIDVHRTVTEQLQGAGQCLNCTHEAGTREDWKEFIQLMARHYKIRIPENTLSFDQNDAQQKSSCRLGL